ncbi:MAG: hypothetical protein HY914_01830 [Desulfomonile tiedjei]|nr:hypothetical protein [Desulfomonile tiedjei]
MEEDRQDKAPGTEAEAIPQDVASQEGKPEELAAEPVESPLAEDPVVQKRGRMIMAGLVAAVILSLIAVVVAGIFQITSRWLITCPTELPVNDPAPILWQQLVAGNTSPQPLGVSPSMESVTKLKGTDEPAGKPEQRPVDKE